MNILVNRAPISFVHVRVTDTHKYKDTHRYKTYVLAVDSMYNTFLSNVGTSFILFQK